MESNPLNDFPVDVLRILHLHHPEEDNTVVVGVGRIGIQGQITGMYNGRLLGVIITKWFRNNDKWGERKIVS